MRYPADQKAKAKEAILVAAGKRLKKDGFGGVGVDGLAGAAGVTSGAFYSNYENKEALLEAAIGRYLGSPLIDSEPGTAKQNQEALRDFLTSYISIGHARDPEAGCVMPALSADVSRASAKVRRTYQARMRTLIDRIVLSTTAPQKRKRAWSVLSMMVGAVTVARALPDGEERRELLESALATALELLAL